MTVVKMTRYIPFPEGVYNLQVVKYDEQESKQKAGEKYYIWTIRILDPLPEEFTKDTFSVLTPTHLTEKNALRKFLTKVGIGAIEVDQEFNLDSLIAYRFVAKVAIKDTKNGGQANELGDITIPEYNEFMQRQGQVMSAPQAPRQPVPLQAPAQTAVPRVAQAPRMAAAPAARPAAAPAAAPRPAAAVAPKAPRPAAAPPPPQPVAQAAAEEESPTDGAEEPLYQDDGTANFPSQV